MAGARTASVPSVATWTQSVVATTVTKCARSCARLLGVIIEKIEKGNELFFSTPNKKNVFD
jgi:hypothetical protein